jgi:hypothetical protein
VDVHVVVGGVDLAHRGDDLEGLLVEVRRPPELVGADRDALGLVAAHLTIWIRAAATAVAVSADVTLLSKPLATEAPEVVVWLSEHSATPSELT